jgi:predicted RNA binding protein YcfA (HicA-like mRNA interferase family)
MPSPVRYAEIQRMLRKHGWVLQRISGSHHMWFKAGVGTFPIPVHKGLVKHGYYKTLKKLCGEE